LPKPPVTRQRRFDALPQLLQHAEAIADLPMAGDEVVLEIWTVMPGMLICLPLAGKRYRDAASATRKVLIRALSERPSP